MSNSNHNQYIQFWIRVADVIIPYRDPQCSEVLLYLSVFHFLFSMLNRSHAYFWSNCPPHHLRGINATRNLSGRWQYQSGQSNWKMFWTTNWIFWDIKSFGASTDLHIYRKPCVQGTSSTAPHPGWINKRNCWWVQWTCSKEPGHGTAQAGESVLSTRSELSSLQTRACSFPACSANCDPWCPLFENHLEIGE